MASLIATSDGGRMNLKSRERRDVVEVCEMGGESRVALGINEYGGIVEVYGKDGPSRVALSIDERGGRVATEVAVIDRYGNVKTLTE